MLMTIKGVELDVEDAVVSDTGYCTEFLDLCFKIFQKYIKHIWSH